MPADSGRRSSKDGTIGAEPDFRVQRRTSAILEAIVLSILCASQAPLGAYVIARQARALGAPVAPNQVYRVLERLGPRVRRLETLNAYVGEPGGTGPVTLCRDCGAVTALDIEIDTDVGRICGERGFKAGRIVAEVVGLCARCRAAEP